MWALWWTWAVAALVLGLLELLAPSFFFLGVALGAAAVALLLLVGGPVGAALAGSLPLVLLFHAVLSLVAWVALRQIVGVRKGQTKRIDRDINED